MLSFPNDSQHHAIMGFNGTGKTLFGLHCLARRSYTTKPWIVIDFKREHVIGRIPGIEEIDVNAAVPRQRGLYVVRPTVADVDDGAVTAMLYRIWERERTGVFLDEGYMLKAQDRGLRTILTQGRSKRTPIIALSQRPAWVSPFLLSESVYKSTFNLPHPRDIERMREWLPDRDPSGRRTDPSTLPRYHSYWYCQTTGEYALMKPCPGEDAILQAFDDRRARRTWSIFPGWGERRAGRIIQREET